jgi:uncharacterized protein (TIGR03083 family)
MPTSLTFGGHVALIESSGARLGDLAADAGRDAPVPTCPDWTVGDLVAHQAMVHRWAAAHVRGDDPAAVAGEAEILASTDDLIGYYRDGLAALVAALRESAPDLEALTFLNDAPPPREFWARRQAHETTIHMADALAAALGRVPTAEEVGIAPAVAVDGIDELLRGFFTRGRSKLYDGAVYAIAVAPADADRRWLLNVAERLTVEPGDAATVAAADATISGSASQLYLALWNRGDEAVAAGRADVLERWRATQRVTWS